MISFCLSLCDMLLLYFKAAYAAFQYLLACNDQHEIPCEALAVKVRLLWTFVVCKFPPKEVEAGTFLWSLSILAFGICIFICTHWLAQARVERLLIELGASYAPLAALEEP